MEKIPTSVSVKEFSKEHAPEERNRAAAEIRTHRKEYFQKKGVLTIEIRNLTVQIRERQADKETIVREIEALEGELAKWKDSAVQRLLHHFQIQKHEKMIRDRSEIRDAFESEYEIMRGRTEELHEQIADKSELEQAKNALKDFYQEQWAAYQEDHETRDVAAIIRDYEALFVHAIHPSYIPQVNSLLHEWVDWKTKLKILLTLGPTISTSTIRSGDTYESLWARMGVVLSGGSVKTADARDAATRAQGLKKRAGWSYQKDIRDRIREAITQKRDRYNELTVENPDVAGFYINTDEMTGIRRSNLAPASEIIPFIKELGLPLYAMRDGELYETEYSDSGDGFISKAKVPAHEIPSRKFRLDNLEREKMLEEILRDSPFQIKSPEVGYIHSRANGQETYIEINLPKHMKAVSGTDRIYEPARDEPDYSLAGKRVKVLAEFSEIGSRVQYFESEGRLWRRREEIHTKKVSLDPIERFDPYDLGYISIGYSTHNLEQPVASSDAYLSGMEESIKKLKQEREQYARKDTLELYDDWVHRLAFHLYGFGEQAETFGDHRIKERSFALAQQIMREDAYHTIVQRRLDGEGHFRIETNDLP